MPRRPIPGAAALYGTRGCALPALCPEFSPVMAPPEISAPSRTIILEFLPLIPQAYPQGFPGEGNRYRTATARLVGEA